MYHGTMESDLHMEQEDSAGDHFLGAESSIASEYKKSDIKLTEISGIFSA